jgi:PAS domain S-box-containing protein
MTVTTLAIFVVSIWALEFIASRILHEDIESLLSEKQLSSASFVAKAVDDELDQRLWFLEAIAAQITPELMGNPAALQTLLEQCPNFQIQFNAGAFVVGDDGVAVANLPLTVKRVGTNYMDRDFIVAALKKGKATVGAPVIGKRLNAPIFVMGVPIRDAQGAVIGALSGVTDLSKPSFLDKISEGDYGRKGSYYLLVCKPLRQIVTSNDKRRIMEKLPPPGVIPIMDNFLKGRDGSTVYVNPLGVDVLASYKSISAADWIVTVATPTSEAFAPIYRMQQRMYLAAVFLTLLAGALNWWMMRRQLAPMLTAISQLNAMPEKMQPLPVTRQDEIGQLVTGFNRLLATVEERTNELANITHELKIILENAPIGISKIIDRKQVLVNQKTIDLFQYSRDEMEFKTTRMLYPSDEAYEKLGKEAYPTLAQGHVYETEQELIRRDGAHIFVKYVGKAVEPTDMSKGTIWLLEDVTERKRTDVALHLTRFVFDNSSEGIFWMNSDADIVDVNEAACRSLGYSREEMLQLTIPDIDHLVNADGWRKDFEAIRQHGSITAETVHSTKDGKQFPVEIVANHIQFGSIELICTFVRNITERKEAEITLQESEQRFRSMFQRHSSIMLLVEPESGAIVDANVAAAQFYGYSRERLQAMNIEMLNTLPPDLIIDKRHKALHNEINYFIFVHKLSSGEIRTVEVHSTPIEVNDRKLLFSIIHDITERNIAEAKIARLSEERSIILSNAGVGISFVMNRHQKWANNTFCEIFGYEPEEMEGSSTGTHFPSQEEYTRFTEEAYPVLASGETFSKSLQMRRKDGTLFQARFTGKAVNPENLFDGAIWILIDETSEYELKENLIEAKLAAEKADRAKSAFLSNMSHEIRTPMNGVIGMAQLLAMSELTEEQKEYVEALHVSGNNLLSLINDILDLSKIEAGMITIESYEFNLKKSLDETFLTQRSAIFKKKLALKVDMSSEIPAVVIGDQLRVKQIISNLLSNAIKFTAQGGITISVLILERYVNSLIVQIAVSDTGIGMSADVLKKIFTPFTQAETSTTRQFGGTGLGLTISRHLAELMEGSITVESTPGVGSCFKLTIPFVISHKVVTTVEPIRNTTYKWDGPKLKILFVEDNPINITYSMALFAKLGFDAVLAENGRDSLAAIEKETFDLVLMDIQMPVMNGEEALREIRRKEQGTSLHLPVIALTAYALRGDKERFLQEGFDGYVSKPMVVEELLDEMKRVVAKNGALSGVEERCPERSRRVNGEVI